MGISKLAWQGEVLAIQPRIRLMRAFDQRNHAYSGYALFLSGTLDGVARLFSVGITGLEKRGLSPVPITGNWTVA